MSNLQLAASQQDSAGDASGVNDVTVNRGGERIAQRARAAVSSVCDYDDVSWDRVAPFIDPLLGLPSSPGLCFRSVSLRQREWDHAYSHP